MPAVKMNCFNCKTELLIPYQLGKDRKPYCGKCAKKKRGKENEG